MKPIRESAELDWSGEHMMSDNPTTGEHKAGCPALGGYGHGIEPCICGAVTTTGEWMVTDGLGSQAEITKPATTTGEWTSQTAYDIYRKDDGGFKAISDAHNAALAAEREAQQAEKQNLVRKYSDALKAEREKVQTLGDALEQIGEDKTLWGTIARQALTKVKEGKLSETE